MAVRKIRCDGDEILIKTAKLVTKFDAKLAEFIDDMCETMLENNGIGLAAPQLGVLKRVVVIDLSSVDAIVSAEAADNAAVDKINEDKQKACEENEKSEDLVDSENFENNDDEFEESEILELINPEIIEIEGVQERIEGCLSLPGKRGIVRRPMKTTVRAFDRSGNEFTVSGEGLLSVAFNHEIDHLNGVLYTERVVKMCEEDEG